MKLELITKRQSVMIWDGWNSRASAHSQRGWGGWYMVLVCNLRSEPTRRRVAYPPKGRTARPRPWCWRRAEVIRCFQRHIDQLKARQARVERQAA